MGGYEESLQFIIDMMYLLQAFWNYEIWFIAFCINLSPFNSFSMIFPYRQWRVWSCLRAWNQEYHKHCRIIWWAVLGASNRMEQVSSGTMIAWQHYWHWNWKLIYLSFWVMLKACTQAHHVIPSHDWFTLTWKKSMTIWSHLGKSQELVEVEWQLKYMQPGMQHLLESLSLSQG